MGKILFCVSAFPHLNVKCPLFLGCFVPLVLHDLKMTFFFFCVAACRDDKYSSWVMVSFL